MKNKMCILSFLVIACFGKFSLRAQSIGISNGILNFSSQADFNTACDSIANGGSITIPSMFKSLASIYQAVLDSEEVFFTGYAITHAPDSNNFVNVHSNYYTANQDILLLTAYEGGGTVLEMNIISSTIARLVNRDGLVIINNEAYAYTKTGIYVSDTVNIATFEGPSSLLTTTWKRVRLFGGVTYNAHESSCNFCSNSSYHYTTQIFNMGFLQVKRQNIVEYYVDQVYSGSCITETRVQARYRHLKQNLYTGSYSPEVVEMYLASWFAGPRSPGTYYESNGYSNKFFYTGDKSIVHCYDWTIGDTNCFSVTHASASMYTPENNAGTTLGF